MQKTNLVVALVASALTLGAVGTPAASSPKYRCSSSSQDIDDAGYSGPWPDNWKIAIEVCAARSGSTVYTYATAKWDGPNYYSVDDPTILDGAKLRLQIKHAHTGRRLLERDFAEIESRLEDSDSSSNHHGRYRTPTISTRAGSDKAVGDAVLLLDWHADGRGYRRYDYAGSSAV
ncbi:hypothetical protein [Streptomyces subrutilus]|uniref:Chitin-binding type-4 domain-containing protein n=1 Tax=Streptomyces subrutilus TaxID=36818 RepID=A0A1E5PKG6_9ACTN|nr:hypothetical protein [Streptomyces subrutilus]OEJ30020.1 hypothetical protein BGK67_00205 [Streptomyces subrutilus]